LARFSLRHPFRSVIDLIFGTPEPAREPPKEPPPPPPGIDYFPPEPPSNYDYDDRRKEIWSEISGESKNSESGAEAWEIFGDTGIPYGTSYFETNAAFDEFLRAFWLKSSDDGSIPRAQFYDDYDIGPDLIDWDHWREWVDTP